MRGGWGALGHRAGLWGRREGPAAGAGGAFRSAAQGGRALDFRSAGHVLHGPSAGTSSHVRALEAGVTPAAVGSVYLSHCVWSARWCWPGRVSSWARLRPGGLSPTLRMSLHLAEGGTARLCGNLETPWQLFCGSSRVLPGHPCRAHLGLWLPPPFLLLGLLCLSPLSLVVPSRALASVFLRPAVTDC